MTSGSQGMGERRPHELAFDEARGRKVSGLKVKWLVCNGGDSGKVSNPSDTDDEGEVVSNVTPARTASNFRRTRPLFVSNLDVSILAARRRLETLPGLPSGLITHQELLPVPSF